MRAAAKIVVGTLCVLVMAGVYLSIALLSVCAGLCHTVAWPFRAAADRLEQWVSE